MSVVMKKLQQLNLDKSPGPDAIHPLLLEECATVLAEPLSMIFQQSFEARTLPADWKTANIVPIFKKGDRTDRANYHPVSLTSVPCKIMESIIKEKLTKLLDSHQLLCKEQHGFSRVRSCLTNLLETLDETVYSTVPEMTFKGHSRSSEMSYFIRSHGLNQRLEK